MINILYNIINTALNKNQMGKISPSEYNSALYEALMKIYAELFADFRKLNYRKMRFQDSAGYGNEAFNLKQVIEYFVRERNIVTSGREFTLAEDVMFLSSVFDEDVEYEKTDLKVFNSLTRSSKMAPTICSPIYTLNENIVKTQPFKTPITITYFRKLKQPKWTYLVVNGVEMFNQDATDFQDIDMHPIMLSRIFVEVLGICGLNLQMDQVENYVNAMKQENIVNKQ
jgi:hypothetical protein